MKNLTKKELKEFVAKYYFYEIECAKDERSINHAEKLLESFFIFLHTKDE